MSRLVLIGAIVDGSDLWQTVAASFVAGIGVTFAFSLAVLGAARFADASRDGKSFAVVAFAGLTVAGLLVTLAAVVIGIALLASG